MQKSELQDVLLEILSKADGIPSQINFDKNGISGLIAIDREILLESHLSAYFHPLSQGNSNLILPNEIEKIGLKCYYENIGRNTLLIAAFKELAQACNEANIRIIPLKGLDLLLNVYENIGLRQLSDLDVLIEKEQLEKFRTVMSTLGYTEIPMLPMKAVELIDYPSPFLYVRKGLHVDLHLKINKKKKFDVNIEQVWNRSFQSELEGVPIFRMDKLDFFIHLCIHLHKHFIVFNHKTIHFLDVKLFYLKNEIAVDELIERAHAYGCQHEVLEILYLIKTFLDLKNIPNEIFESLPDEKRSELENRFLLCLNTSKIDLEKSAVPEPFFRIPQLSKKQQFQYVVYYLFPSFEFVRSINKSSASPVLLLYINRLFSESWNIVKPRFKRMGF
jgi:hypothetical protein